MSAIKDPSIRARRNKSTTRSTLASQVPKGDRPALPVRADVKTGLDVPWHPLTVAWWEDVWSSPMAPEWAQSDSHGILVLAQLIDDYWTAGNRTARTEIAAEIRLQRQGFGLSPLDRRRLEWQIEQTDAAKAQGTARRTARSAGVKQPVSKADPRRGLHSVG